MTSVEKQNWNLELTTNEILVPVFKPFVNELKELRGFMMDSETVDDTVKRIVTDLCVEIITIIAKFLFAAIKQRIDDTDDLPRSPDRLRVQELAVSEKQVLDSLGDVIPNTLSKAVGDSEYIRTENTEEMNWLMAEEITEQINSNLYTDPVIISPQPSRLQRIVAKAMEIMRCTCCKIKRNQQGKIILFKREKVFVKTQQRDFDVTDISYFDVDESTRIVSYEDIDAAKDITKDIVTGSLKDVLNEHMNSLKMFTQNTLTEEEYDELAASISLDIDRVSNRTSAAILGSSLLETDKVGTLTEPDGDDVTSTLVNRWMTTLFVHRFFKESILRFVSRIKSKSPTELKQHPSLQQLFDAGDLSLDSMIPRDKAELILSDIEADDQEMVRKLLGDILLRHFQLPDQAVQDVDEIKNEQDFFMKYTWDWVNRQAQQHKTRLDAASLSLREIEKATVVTVPTYKEDVLQVERETYIPVFDVQPSVVEEVVVAPVEIPPQEDNQKEKLCQLLVSGLVSHILEGLCVYIPLDVIKAIISKLKEMLMIEMVRRDISFRANGLVINRIIRSVLRDLFEDMGSMDVIRINLMLQEEQIFKDIIRALAKNLTATESKSGVISSFRTVFKTMSRQFNRRE